MEREERELLERVEALLTTVVAALERFGPLLDRLEKKVPEGVAAWAARRKAKSGPS